MPYNAKQRRLFGMVAAGKATHSATHLKPEDAKKMLSEGKVKAQRKLIKGLPPSPK